MPPRHLENIHTGNNGVNEGLDKQRDKWRWNWKKNCGKEERWLLHVKSKEQKKKKMKSPSHPSTTLLHYYLYECSQAPAPLAETKWLTGIWCNLHLSAKSWILFLWSRCWRAWQKAQLTGLRSWEWCVWPTYRGSSSQQRATILMENG